MFWMGTPAPKLIEILVMSAFYRFKIFVRGFGRCVQYVVDIQVFGVMTIITGIAGFIQP
jgi:hypothetical protein